MDDRRELFEACLWFAGTEFRMGFREILEYQVVGSAAFFQPTARLPAGKLHRACPVIGELSKESLSRLPEVDALDVALTTHGTQRGDKTSCSEAEHGHTGAFRESGYRCGEYVKQGVGRIRLAQDPAQEDFSILDPGTVPVTSDLYCHSLPGCCLLLE